MLTPLSDPRLPTRPPVRVGFVGAIGRSCFGDLWLRARPAREIAFAAGSRAALLAALAAGELDLAVHPGPPAAGVATALLCHDHLVLLLGIGHRLASDPTIALEQVCSARLLLPTEGDGGDLRRLVHALSPTCPPLTELSPVALEAKLRDGAIAIAPAALADELGAGIVARPIAGPDTRFPVQIAWLSGDPDLAALLRALGLC